MPKRALSLLEIIVALVILVVIMAGLTNLFISGKRWILHARARMTGSEIGKHFLDPLQMQVRQRDWGTIANCLSNPLVCGGASQPPCTCDTTSWPDPSSGTPLNLITYIPEYRIAPIGVAAPLGNLRKVVLTLTWQERTANP